MTRTTLAALILIASTAALAAGTPQTYAEATAQWQLHMNGTDYQTYAGEFAQFNNHFHLDEKGGCYAVAPGSVTLMLVITHSDNSEFAVIEQALSDVDNAKAECFKRSYRGLQTKIPPYLPFVLQMHMG